MKLLRLTFAASTTAMLVLGMSCESAPKLAPQPIVTEDDSTPAPIIRDVQSRPNARALTRKNGLQVLLVPGDPLELSRVTLWVRAGPGRDRDSKPGLAELTARSLLLSGRGLKSGTTLQQSLQELGARIDLSFEGEWVRFEGSCLPAHTDKVVQLLFRLVTQETPSQDEIDLARQTVLGDYAANFSELRWQRALERLLGEPGPNVALEQEAIKSYGTTEVRLFVGIHYRPNHSMLVVQTPPGSPDAATIAKAIELFDPWRKGQDIAKLANPDVVRPLGFVERDGTKAEVTAVLLSPDPALVGSIAPQVVWQLFDRNGVAGLLRKRLDERGFRDIKPRTSDLDTGRNQVRTIRMEVEAAQTTQLLETLREAFADLGVTDPGIAEFRRAKQMSHFLWNQTVVDSASRARAFARAKIYSGATDIDKRVQTEIGGVRERTVSSIATDRFIPLFLVRGPLSSRPKTAEDLPIPKVTIATVLEESRIRPLRAEPDEIAKIAKKGLESAAFALGGRDRLQNLRQFYWVAHCKYQASIPFDERWTVALPAGERKRVRMLLGSPITTVRTKDGTTETFQRNRRNLGSAERAYFDLEALTNPGALFALWSQKTIQLELEGELLEDDRRLLVYVWQPNETKALRIGIDAENGLPRRLDTWAWRPSALPQRITWLFRDYRSVAGGMRLPHLAEKYVEGQIRGEQVLEYAAPKPK